MRKEVLALSLATLGLGTACGATVGTSSGVSVPKDSPSTCATFCTDMGMTLGAVVIMANNVGCVCSPNKAAALDDKSATVAGGMAAIEAQEEQQRRQQQPASH